MERVLDTKDDSSTELRGAPDEDVPRASSASQSHTMLPRQMRGVMAVAAVTWAVFAVRDAVGEHHLALQIELIFTVLSILTLVALVRIPHATMLLAHVGIAVSALGVTALAMVTGQTHSPALWYLVSVPLFAGYLFGLRTAGLWAGSTVLLIAGVELSRRFYPIPVEMVIGPGELAFRMSALVLLLFVLAVATNRGHAAQLEAFEERGVTIQELVHGLAQKTDELVIARDEALAASRTKSEFLAMMSHEIRTPLNGVLGLTGVLLDAPLPIEQQEIVRTIRSSGDALLLLLNDLLDFSKIEAGELQLEQAPFSITACAEDAIDLFAATAADKGIDLCCIVSPQVPAEIQGDSGRVRQILVNLVSNAVKFTPRGRVEVVVDAEPASDGEAPAVRVHCQVRDTGIGIPEEHLSKLFKPFSQIDISTTRRFGGTGLGLAICRTLAERMNGEIWVESKPGEGTTFHVRFLTSVVVAVESLRAETLGNGRRALVVSGREGARSAVLNQLASWGFRATGGSTIAELAGLEDAQRPELVVAEEPADPAYLQSYLASLEPPPALVLLSAARPETVARSTLRERWGAAVPIVALPARRAVLRDAIARALNGESPPATHSLRPQAMSEKLPLRILVAEDNPVNQRVALLLLERLGYRADVAGNGAEAIEAIGARPYDVVLMDVRMPEVDGLEATRIIRRTLPRERQPRIVALTANAMNEDRSACVEAGMDDFLAKPISITALERALRERATAIAAAAAVNDTVAIDAAKIEALRWLTAGQPEVLREIVEEYFSTADRLLGAMRDGIEAGDASAVEHAAHALKGGSGQMGAAGVMGESALIEQAAKTGDLDEARSRLPQLVRQQEMAVSALHAVCEAPG